MTVITDLQRAFYPIDGDGKITLQDIVDTAAGEGSVPTGSDRLVLSWDTAGKPEAVPFSADMWSDFPDGAPRTGNWIPAAMFDNPVDEPRLGFVGTEFEPVGNTIPIRASGNPGGEGAGRLKVGTATEPNDAVTLAQLNALVARVAALEAA